MSDFRYQNAKIILFYAFVENIKGCIYFGLSYINSLVKINGQSICIVLLFGVKLFLIL